MRFNARWMTFRLAVLAVAILGVAFAWTVAASAYNTVWPASTAATVDASVWQDTVPTSGGGESATGTLRVTLDMDDDGHWDMSSGWWIIMPIMMVLFWGGVIAVAVRGVRQFTGERDKGQGPLDIAKEEFDRIRGDLV